MATTRSKARGFCCLAFVVAAATLLTLDGWLAVGVLAAGRVGARFQWEVDR